MAQTQINGATQIRLGTITSDRLLDNTIADGKLAENYIKADGTRAFTGDVDLDGYRLTYVGDPQSASDAATKSYVDGLIQGFDWKQSVRVATTASGDLSTDFHNGSQVDGVTLVTGDRVLVKDQATGSENGIYVVNVSGSPTRADDFNSDQDATTGVTVFVSEGSVNANSAWSISTNDPIVLGTSPVVFVQVGGGSLYKAGNGLTLDGSTFNINAADASITVGTDTIQVGIGDSSLEVDGGLRVVHGTGGQVYIADATGALTPTTLSGDVANVTNSGSVTLDANILRISWFITRETPTGSVNGTNTVYNLANTPISGSESVFLNGLLQEPGSGNDYTISGSTITFAEAPVVGDRVRVSYVLWD